MRGQAHSARSVPNWVVGIVLIVVLSVGSVLAYTKTLPWATGYDVTAVFDQVGALRGDSPVRIAGVNIGEVTSVEPAGEAVADGDGEANPNAVIVTMRLNESARPIKTDATFKLRPRLFLDGNYFIDLEPGTPDAPEAGDGHEFPVNQTSASVQFGQVLSTFQHDIRSGLQSFLREFGSALVVHGGADGWRELYRSAPDANRYTAEVQTAFLGTEDGDLRGMVAGLTRVLRGLSRDQQTLSDFVTSFRTVTGSFAAEDEALGRAIEQLPPTLAAADPAFSELRAALPSMRAFAREALPGVRTGEETYRVARPFVRQVRLLMSEPELRTLMAELRPTVPHLARLARGNIKFLEQSRAISSCFNQVIIPWSHDTVKPVDPNNVYPHEPSGRVFEESGYGLAGIAGESRSGDAASQYIRVVGAGGPNLVRFPNLGGVREDAFGLTPFPILGAMPRIGDSKRTEFKPDEPCEEQEPPNLEAGISAPPDQEQLSLDDMGINALRGPGADEVRRYASVLGDLGQILALREAGEGRRAGDLIDGAQGLFDKLGVPEVDIRSTLRQMGGQR